MPAILTDINGGSAKLNASLTRIGATLMASCATFMTTGDMLYRGSGVAAMLWRDSGVEAMLAEDSGLEVTAEVLCSSSVTPTIKADLHICNAKWM